MSCDIVSAHHIKKRYGRKTVLRDTSVHVAQGEIYGLIGKNGSGKTTLLRILSGLIPGYEGTVGYGEAGNDTYGIAAVIHAPSLFLNMSAFENMKAQSILLGIREDDRIREVLRTVGLEDCGRMRVKDFSLGMTQRLKLGMALLGKPGMLFLDEPVNGLDPEGIADLRELLLFLNREKGVTILISSHILSELAHIATRIGILCDGMIVEEVSVQDMPPDTSALEELYMRHTRGGKS